MAHIPKDLGIELLIDGLLHLELIAPAKGGNHHRLSFSRVQVPTKL